MRPSAAPVMPSYFNWIDALRGAAALAVVVFHYRVSVIMVAGYFFFGVTLWSLCRVCDSVFAIVMAAAVLATGSGALVLAAALDRMMRRAGGMR